MEKAKYEDCEIEVIAFDAQDVIVTSVEETESQGNFETPVH